MNLSKIQYFFRAAELENFTKAAEDCHIAQTTMSKYIAELEDELDIALFHRGVKTVTLTEEGRTFYSEMKKISDAYEQLCRQLQMADRKDVHIGMITRDYAEFPVLGKFKNAEPKADLSFSYGEEKEMIDDFLHRRLDALICPDFVADSLLKETGIATGIARKNLSVSREILIYSRELKKEYSSLEEILSHLPLVTKTDVGAYTQVCRKNLQDRFGAAFTQVEVVKEFHQQVLTVNMAKGFAIVPELTYYDGKAV